jgi:hypothetical protein
LAWSYQQKRSRFFWGFVVKFSVFCKFQQIFQIMFRFQFKKIFYWSAMYIDAHISKSYQMMVKVILITNKHFRLCEYYLLVRYSKAHCLRTRSSMQEFF